MTDGIDDDWEHPLYSAVWLQQALEGKSVTDIAEQCIGIRPSLTTITERIHEALLRNFTLH